MSRMCDKSVFVIFRPININYCHSRGCNLEYNLHSVFSQRPCSPDTYFALQYYSRLHYFALYFACFLSLKRIGSLVNEDDDFHNLGPAQCLLFPAGFSIKPRGGHSSLTLWGWRENTTRTPENLTLGERGFFVYSISILA